MLPKIKIGFIPDEKKNNKQKLSFFYKYYEHKILLEEMIYFVVHVKQSHENVVDIFLCVVKKTKLSGSHFIRKIEK